MTEKITDDDNNGCNDNYDGDSGNSNDNDDKKHTIIVNFGYKIAILGTITWSKKGQKMWSGAIDDHSISLKAIDERG